MLRFRNFLYFFENILSTKVDDCGEEISSTMKIFQSSRMSRSSLFSKYKMSWYYYWAINREKFFNLLLPSTHNSLHCLFCSSWFFLDDTQTLYTLSSHWEKLSKFNVFVMTIDLRLAGCDRLVMFSGLSVLDRIVVEKKNHLHCYQLVDLTHKQSAGFPHVWTNSKKNMLRRRFCNFAISW